MSMLLKSTNSLMNSTAVSSTGLNKSQKKKETIWTFIWRKIK